MQASRPTLIILAETLALIPSHRFEQLIADIRSINGNFRGRGRRILLDGGEIFVLHRLMTR